MMNTSHGTMGDDPRGEIYHTQQFTISLIVIYKSKNRDYRIYDKMAYFWNTWNKHLFVKEFA